MATGLLPENVALEGARGSGRSVAEPPMERSAPAAPLGAKRGTRLGLRRPHPRATPPTRQSLPDLLPELLYFLSSLPR